VIAAPDPFRNPWLWKAASSSFSANAEGTARKVGAEAGTIWRTIEQPILNFRNIVINHIP
jgi:hypothetical protein